MNFKSWWMSNNWEMQILVVTNEWPIFAIFVDPQVQERKPTSKVDLEDHLLVSDEEDEELVQVEENVKAQKAASEQMMRTKEEPASIFRFPSPPPGPQNER